MADELLELARQYVDSYRDNKHVAVLEGREATQLVADFARMFLEEAQNSPYTRLRTVEEVVAAVRERIEKEK